MKNLLKNIKIKILCVIVLFMTILSVFFVISKTIFTILIICVIISILMKLLGDIKMFSFLKHFGKSKAKSAGNETRKMIARLDREGFTDAVLGEMQEQLEKFGSELAVARKRAAKENAEYIEKQTLYNQRLEAAELLKKDADAGDSSKEQSLLKIVELLENTAVAVQTEKDEAEFWNAHLETIQNRYDKAANDLRTARSKISQSTAKMEQAEIKEEQAKLKAEEMKRVSGLSSSMTSLDAALGALDDATTKAEIKAEAAHISLDTFTSTNLENEDANIKSAMEAASGKGSSLSISDRLASLK